MSTNAVPALLADDRRAETASGLVLYASLRGESEVFRAFFDGYDKAFVLPDEKEEEAGFISCLELNHGAANAELVERYGAFHEICLVAHDRASGARVGGANFIASPRDGCVTANLNYIYVDEAARAQGNFGRLTSGVRQFIGGLFGRERDALVFIEQNDPLAMSEAAYERDTRFTGLDQLDRLRIWAKAGARVVDFPYVQPPLSDAQGADETLLYSVLGARRAALPACALEAHLRCFFGVSVLKGAPIAAQPHAARQIAELERACNARAEIKLIDPSPLLARLRSRADARTLSAPPPSSFREAIALLS